MIIVNFKDAHYAFYDQWISQLINENQWISMIRMFKYCISLFMMSMVTWISLTTDQWKDLFSELSWESKSHLILMWHTIEIYFLEFCHGLTWVTVRHGLYPRPRRPQGQDLITLTKLAQYAFILKSHYISTDLSYLSFLRKKQLFLGSKKLKSCSRSSLNPWQWRNALKLIPPFNFDYLLFLFRNPLDTTLVIITPHLAKKTILRPFWNLSNFRQKPREILKK